MYIILKGVSFEWEVWLVVVSEVGKTCLEAAYLQGILVRSKEADWNPHSCQNKYNITQGFHS